MQMRHKLDIPASLAAYGLAQRVQYRHMPTAHLPRICTAVLLLLKNGWRVRLWRTLNVFRYGTQVLSLRPFYLASSLPSSCSYDVVHAHYGPNGTSAVLLREMGFFDSSTPVVTTFYGIDVLVGKQKGPSFYASLAQHGDRILCLSQYVRESLIELGFSPERCMIHPVGIDPAQFPYRGMRPNRKEREVRPSYCCPFSGRKRISICTCGTSYAAAGLAVLHAPL